MDAGISTIDTGLGRDRFSVFGGQGNRDYEMIMEPGIRGLGWVAQGLKD
jgi:hypothetical protein